MRHTTALAIVLSLLLVPFLYGQAACPTVPPPTVTLVSGQNPACVRNTMTLEASAGYASYRWSDGNTNRQRTIYPSWDGPGAISVVGIDANGCESAPAQYRWDQGGTLNVSIYLNGSQYLCDGATGGTLQAYSYGGGPVVSRQWEWRRTWDGPGTPIPGATGEYYQVKASDLPGPGEYHIACVVTPTCGTPKFGTQYVRLGSDLPEPHLGWTPKVCIEGTGRAQVLSRYESYLWTITNGEFVNVQYGSADPTSTDIGFRPLGEGTVTLTLTGTASGGCTTSKTIEIPVEPPPVPQMYGPAATCPTGQNLMVSAYGMDGHRTWSAVHGTLTYPYGYPQEYWDDHVYVTPDGSGLPIEVSVTNEPYMGCLVTATHTIDIVTSAVPLELYRNGSPACVGGSETVYANGAYSDYVWSATNATIVPGPYGSATFSPISNGPVTVSVTGSGTGQCPGAGSFTYTPPNDDPPVLQPDTTSICPLAQGEVFISNRGHYQSVTTSIVNGTILTSPTNRVRFTANGAGPVTITVVGQAANDGCRYTSSVTIPLRDTPPPPVVHLAQPDMCSYGSLQASIDPAPYPVQWTVTNGQITAGQGSAQITFTSNSSVPPVVQATLYGPMCPVPSQPVTVPFRQVSAPVISLSATDVCPNGTIQASIAGTYDYISWYVQNGSIEGGIGTNTITLRPTNGSQSPSVSVLVTANGCEATTLPVTVPIHVLPAPVITLAGTDVCPNGTIQASIAGTYDYISWYVQNGSIESGIGTNTITLRPTNGSQSPSVSVLVTANGCEATTLPVTVPIHVLPAPVITLAGTDVCPNGTIQASIAGSYNYISWYVQNGSIESGIGTNTITIRATNGSQSPSVSVLVTANGCEAMALPVTVPIHVLPAPVITLSAPDVCPNGTVQASIAGSYNYVSWYVQNGSIESGIGTNTITIRATNGSQSPTVSVLVTANGCEAVTLPVTVPIRVLPAPAITLSAPDVCPNGTVQASIAGTYDSISWYVQNGAIESGAGTNTITIRATHGSQTPSVSVLVSANSCQAVTLPVTVPIRVLPAPAITLSAPDVCPNGTVQASIAGTYDSISWSVQNGAIESGAGTNTITIRATNFSQPLTVSVLVAANSCQAMALPVTVPFRVLAPPVIQLDAPELCGSGTNGASAPAGHELYSWSLQNGTILSGWGTDHIEFQATGLAAVEVGLMIMDGGCSAGSQVTVPVVVPAATVTPDGPTTFCAGGSVTLTATEGASYLWTTGATTRSIVVDATGSYGVKVSTAGGCEATSAEVAVTVTDRPYAAVSASGPTTFCAGGSVTLTAPAAASYLWSSGATTRSIAVTDSGSYSVTITSDSGCSATSPATAVTVSPLPSTPAITAGGPTSFCTGGSVTLTAPAGFTYLWSNGATTQSVAVSTAGSYSVTVTNANGCSATSAATTVTVNALPATPAITAGGSTTFCTGGSVTLTAPDGFSYLWSNGATTQSIAVSAAGSYSVTVTNANGCSATSAATTVTVNPLPSTPAITAGGPTSFCMDGSVTLTAPAGFSYLWSNGATTQSIVVSAAGSYSVTVTNANGCSTASAATTVTVNPLPATPAITPSGPTTFCTGGSVTLSAPAGFTYLWSNGATTQSIAVNTSGNYSVTVKNANGCSATSAATTVTVNTLPTTPAITAGGPTTFCAGGSVTLTAPAGFAAYLWTNGATTQSITVSTTGSYRVTVTNAGGCTAQSAATAVTVRALPNATITPRTSTSFCNGSGVWLDAPLASVSYLWSDGATTRSIYVTTSGTWSVTVRDSNGCAATSAPVTTTKNTPVKPTITPDGPTTFCPGGSVTLTSSEGVSYLWSTGETTRSIVAAPTTAVNYTVAVTDTNGCTATSDPTLVIASGQMKPGITKYGISPFCQGGNVTLATSQSAGYTYLWSNGATTPNVTITEGGTYTVTVTNSTGCSNTSDPMVIETPWPRPTAVVSGSTSYCGNGSAVIRADLTGTAPFSVTWSDGVTFSAVTGSFVTRTVSPTSTRTYTVTVTDAYCSASGTGSAVVTVKGPTPVVTITPGGPTTFCEGGSVNLAASTGNFYYLWSDGVTTRTNTVSAAGTYSVTVTDAQTGCSAVSAPVTVTVNAKPATPAITAGGPTTFCAGGSVTLTAPAGFTYLWSNGATTQSIAATATGSYSVTVTNASGCSTTSAATVVTVNAKPPTPAITPSGPTTFCTGGSVTLTAPSGFTYLWSTGETTRSIVATSAGAYSVTVTNANGCSATSAATVVTVNAPPAATITAGGPTTFCAGGSVTLTASSGTSYLWSNGATTQSIAATASGSYSVTVTNASGCSATSAATVVTVNAPPTATITAGGPTTFCTSGSVTLTASSGTSYLWSNGATTPSIAVSTSGSYSVTVTNASGCSATSAATVVTVNAPPAATITAGGPTTFCAGGSVTLTASSGASYLWSNGATTSSIVATVSGSYSVTVTNGSGCSATSAATVVAVNAAPATPAITPSGPTTFCAGGSVTLAAPAGFDSYLWTNGATTQSITVSTTGSYRVTVTNASGCSAQSAATSVTVRSLPNATITATSPTTFCNGSGAYLEAPLSTSYLWSTGATTRSIYVTTSGTWSVTVTDANGCSATSAPVTTTKNTPVKPTITADGPTTFCPGGSVTLTASEGVSYLWSTGETTRSIVAAPTSAQGYTVTVKDANGCTMTSDMTTVFGYGMHKPTITKYGTSPFCQGQNVTLGAPQSTGYTYLWSNGATTPNITVYQGGTYSVTITNSTGCSNTSDPVVIEEPWAQPTAAVSGSTSYCGSGSATIRADLTGTAPFSVQWSDGVTQSGITDSFVTRMVSPTSTQTYTALVSDAHCGAYYGTGSAVITVHTAPATPAITASGPTAFCTGGSVTLTAPAGFTYLWSNGATTQSTSVATSGSYTVTVTNASGCSATSTPTTVTVNATPATPVITAGGPTTFCAGGSVTLTAPAGFTYLWSNGATTQSINATSSGSYSVTVTNASGCSSSSAATAVTVNAATSISSQPQNVTIARNASATLSVTASGTGTLTYQWYKGTSPSTTTPIAGATAASYTTPKLAKGTYTYWVRVTGTCGVVNSSTATVSVP